MELPFKIHLETGSFARSQIELSAELVSLRKRKLREKLLKMITLRCNNYIEPICYQKSFLLQTTARFRPVELHTENTK